MPSPDPDLQPYNPPLVPPAPATSTIFDPPEDRIPQILEHLDSPMASLYMVAQANHTSLEALSLWLARPDVRARNAQIDSAAAARNRSLATRNLRRAVAVLAQTLDRCAEEDRDQPFSHDPTSILARTRNRDLARKSGQQLLQIARFEPSLPTPVPPPAMSMEESSRSPSPTPKPTREPRHNRIARFLNQPPTPAPTFDAGSTLEIPPPPVAIRDFRFPCSATPRTLLARAGQPPPSAVQPPPPKLSPYVNKHEGRDPALVPDHHSHDP